MRALLIMLAACATAAPPQPPATAVQRAATPAPAPPAPDGMFVADLISHRLGSEPALMVAGPQAAPTLPRVTRRRLATGVRRVNLRSLDVAESMVVTIEYCIDESGAVTSAHASGASFDDTVVAEVRTWRFTPYFIDGKPRKVCSFVSLDGDPMPPTDLTPAPRHVELL